VLCAAEIRRETSLESGLKYLVIGSVGSATLVYGLAMIYGASGSTDFSGIARRHGRTGRRPPDARRDRAGARGVRVQGFGRALPPVDPRRLRGRADPDHGLHGHRDQGGPRSACSCGSSTWPLVGAQNTWAPWLAVLATITIIVGNVGALGQSSLKRMLAYSGVAQAGYMLAGVVVGTQLGVQATVLYLIVYLRDEPRRIRCDRRPRTGELTRDDISSLAGLGRSQPGSPGR